MYWHRHFILNKLIFNLSVKLFVLLLWSDYTIPLFTTKCRPMNFEDDLSIYNEVIKSLPQTLISRTAVVHLNFRAGSTFPVPVCTVYCSMDRTSRCKKVDAVRLYASYRLNLLLLKILLKIRTVWSNLVENI